MDMVLVGVDRRGQRRLAAGLLAEVVGAIGAVILSAIGLSGVLPPTLAAIAAISLGGGLLFEGAALAFGLKGVDSEARQSQSLEWAGAIVGKILGGMGGIVVGILVLFGAAAPTLLPLGVLIFGATFLFTSMVSFLPNTQEIAGAAAFVLGLLGI